MLVAVARFQGRVGLPEFSRALLLSEFPGLIAFFCYFLLHLFFFYLIIDFSTVSYLSSAVLGKLMAIHKGVSATKGVLVLCGITPNILEVFKITKLDKLFSIETDVKNGLKLIEKK